MNSILNCLTFKQSYQQVQTDDENPAPSLHQSSGKRFKENVKTGQMASDENIERANSCLQLNNKMVSK